jgi:hypothetical protein
VYLYRYTAVTSIYTFEKKWPLRKKLVHSYELFFTSHLTFPPSSLQESVKIYTEEEDSLMEHIESLIQAALEDFVEEDNDIKDQAAQDAAAMAPAYITEGT